MNEGVVTRIIGPVLDVRFPTGDLPPILNALSVQTRQGERIIEVHSHLDQTTVRGIAMSSTMGLTRGLGVVDTGAQISVPVGPGTRGRMFDALGRPIDGLGELEELTLVHTHAPEEAEVLARKAGALIPEGGPSMSAEVTPVIGTHIGPGAVGFVAIKARE